MASTTGCRALASVHGRLQREISELREYGLDESVERSTDQVVDEAAAVMRRLLVAAQHVRRRAERLHPDGPPAAGTTRGETPR